LSEAQLESLGYSDRWRALFAPYGAAGMLPGRVLRADRGSVLLATAAGVTRARPSAGLRKRATGALDLPAVGDWVAAQAEPGQDLLQIEAILDRTGAITRGDPGETSRVQVLAANVDTVFIVHSVSAAPNLRRIERELALAWDGGAVPVVVLTKADLEADPQAAADAITSSAPGVEVRVTSAVSGAGVEALMAYAAALQTVALIGPSGAGKSTLINALLGEERQATREVRLGDGKGRHTTVTRELVPLPGGGVLVDTPGLRALAVTASQEGISAVFHDVERLAEDCRFRDCTHSHEPGCAVRAAVEAGTLGAERLAGYDKLVREAHAAARKTDARLRAAEAGKWKIINKSMRTHYRDTGRG
jgi:ribosome biogenesis GTPase / thiamine phosphate phosphatase